MMFTKQVDMESTGLHQKNGSFVKHIELDDSFFESENQNSHLLKQLRVVRRLATEKKLKDRVNAVGVNRSLTGLQK